jgi:hypothetical protein
MGQYGPPPQKAETATSAAMRIAGANLRMGLFSLSRFGSNSPRGLAHSSRLVDPWQRRLTTALTAVI